jgi:Ni/Co efflux regulator RcnB
MSKRKVLELAAAALLAFGVQQISGAATAAAQETKAESSDDQPSIAKAVYNERRPTERRGNIYGAHGVIGRSDEARRGYYGAAGRRSHHYAHRYYRPRAFAGRGYYGAAGYYPRSYAHRYYRTRPVVADGYYGSTSYYPQFYAHRYYPTRPVAADGDNGSGSYFPQYYAHRYYRARPGYGDGAAVATTSPLGSIFAPTNWSTACVNGRVCTSAYYRGAAPICRSWAACNY